jgi:hypothetical protein
VTPPAGNGMDLAVITEKDGFQLVDQSEIDALLASHR